MSVSVVFLRYVFFCVFSLLVVLVRLLVYQSIPVQVIDWKDSSQK